MAATHADVDGRFHFASQPADFVIFQHAQQFRLGGRGHFADFVEQQRAAVGQFEAADAAFGGAGECAFFVPENFAFHQRFGNGRAIDGDEGAVGARREHVNRARHHFFARAGFAGDEHRSGGGRGHFHLAHHFLHGRGCADQRAEFPALHAGRA